MMWLFITIRWQCSHLKITGKNVHKIMSDTSGFWLEDIICFLLRMLARLLKQGFICAEISGSLHKSCCIITLGVRIPLTRTATLFLSNCRVSDENASTVREAARESIRWPQEYVFSLLVRKSSPLHVFVSDEREAKVPILGILDWKMMYATTSHREGVTTGQNDGWWFFLIKMM